MARGTTGQNHVKIKMGTPSEGASSDCKVVFDERIFVKTYKDRHYQRHISGVLSNVWGVIPSEFTASRSLIMGIWRMCCKEHLPETELKILGAVFELLQNGPWGVRVPAPLRATQGRLELEFIPGCVRFESLDRAGSEQLMATAVVEVARLFFAMIKILGVVHGDVNEQNVLLDAGGNPVLVDFGSCFYLVDEEKRALDNYLAKARDLQDARGFDFTVQHWLRGLWSDNWEEVWAHRATPGQGYIQEWFYYNCGEFIIPFANSLCSLTRMATQISPAALRQAEQNNQCPVSQKWKLDTQSHPTSET